LIARYFERLQIVFHEVQVPAPDGQLHHDTTYLSFLSKKIFFPDAERGMPYATVQSPRSPRARAVTPAEYITRLSTLWRDAVFTAEPLKNLKHIYQYDDLGWVGNLGNGDCFIDEYGNRIGDCTDTAWFANVHDAHVVIIRVGDVERLLQ
jgi:hypothetical protein